MKYPGHSFAFSLFAAVLTMWLVVMAVLMRASALHDDATGTMLVVFEPGTSADAAFSALTRAGAKPLRQTSFGFIWVVDGEAGKLRAAGAIGAYRELPLNPTLAGCVAIADAKVAAAFGL
jgi:hypothetical protein